MRTRLALTLLFVGLIAIQADSSPNIIFIMADDLGWSDTSNTLTNMGNPSDFYETPTIARLASEGMAFTNAYASQNCAPTRAAILTGQYAPRSTNNVYQVDSLNRGGSGTMLVGPAQGLPSGTDAIPNSAITYAETLQTAGYTTAHFGKFHVVEAGTASSDIVNFMGFDENYGGNTNGGPGNYHASNGKFGNKISSSLDAYAGNYTQQYVDDNIKPYANGTSASAIDALVGTNKHVSDALADAAIDFMEREKNGSFLVQFNTYAVHTPVGNSQARSDLLNKYQNKTPGTEDSNASFGALIEGLDQSVARLIDYLETTPDPNNPGQTLDQNTLVVFTSDNGGRQSQSNNGPLKGQKGELDEGGIRVPMVAWSGNPALVDGGTVNNTPVTSVDFYKTYANVAGATLPGGTPLDGEDLSGVIADNTATLTRDNIYWHLPGYLIGGGRDQHPQTVTRSGDWKLMYNYEDQSYELYDLASDISETANVASGNQAVVDDMGMDMINWLDSVDAPLATLRSGTLEVVFTGTSYANGVVSTHTNETITINPGEEVPIFLGQFGGNPPVFSTISFDASAPSDPLIANEQTNGAAAVIRLEAANPSDGNTETRNVGQTFELATTSFVDAIVVKARQARSYDASEHILQLAIMEDTDADGIGDTLVGSVQSYDLSNTTIPDENYITMFLDTPVQLDEQVAYHFELFWSSADLDNDLNLHRSGNSNGAYADGKFINLIDNEAFPAGSLMGDPPSGPGRDMTFFILAPSSPPIPEPASLALLSLGTLVLQRRSK